MFRLPSKPVTLLACTLTACGAVPPELRGTSRHIELVSWADFTPCNSALPELDTFIDEVFLALEEPAPSTRFIELQWFSPLDREEHSEEWPCSADAHGCAFDTVPLIKVASLDIEHRHELVHAVHLQALGPGPPLLREGLASYYGNPYRDHGLATSEFEGKLVQLLESVDSIEFQDYAFARRFVGATIERHGVTQFKSFWRNTPEDASSDDFRASYESIYSESFDDALALIATHQTVGDPLTRCVTPPVPWISEDYLEFTIGGRCEDEGSIGPLLLDPFVFQRRFTMDIVEDGFYEFQAIGSSFTGTALVGNSCGATPAPQFWNVQAEAPHLIELSAGRYLITAGLHEADPPESVQVRVTKIQLP